VSSGVPEKLTISIHLSFFPTAVMGLSVEPNIPSLAFEKVILKLSFVVLNELISPEML
jgi:hypothetical protein